MIGWYDYVAFRGQFASLDCCVSLLISIRNVNVQLSEMVGPRMKAKVLSVNQCNDIHLAEFKQ